jgi:hypothetical protein
VHSADAVASKIRCGRRWPGWRLIRESGPQRRASAALQAGRGARLRASALPCAQPDSSRNPGPRGSERRRRPRLGRGGPSVRSATLARMSVSIGSASRRADRDGSLIHRGLLVGAGGGRAGRLGSACDER